MPSLAAILVALLMVSPLASAVQLYRWIDDSGHVTFTDSPTPPSPTHRLMETQTYAPPTADEEERGQRRMEELRSYNRDTPPVPASSGSSGPVFSKAECEAAMRHYQLESESGIRTPDSVAAAEAQMRTRCNRPERETGHAQERHRSHRERGDFERPCVSTGPRDYDCR